jgi:hypothetical protein
MMYLSDTRTDMNEVLGFLRKIPYTPRSQLATAVQVLKDNLKDRDMAVFSLRLMLKQCCQ